jgi:hypothetical protein
MFVLFLQVTFDVLIQLLPLVFEVVMQLSLGINGGNLCTGLYEAMKPFKSFISSWELLCRKVNYIITERALYYVISFE